VEPYRSGTNNNEIQQNINITEEEPNRRRSEQKSNRAEEEPERR
jgi:hypothetical protein